MTANLKALVQRLGAHERKLMLSPDDACFPTQEAYFVRSIREELAREIERMESERQVKARTAETPETGAADAWLDGGWRNDPPEQVTHARIMLMTARGSRKSGTIDPELQRLAGANLVRRVQPRIDALRAEQAELMAMCRWPLIGSFSIHDDPDEHKPCYLVCPDGAMIELKHHAENGVDKARARWIAAACNAALPEPPQ